MKTFLSAAFSLSLLLCQAQLSLHPVSHISIQNPMTPLLILEHFSRTNADAIPFWGMEKNNYTVRYIDPVTALGHKIVYNSRGAILRSENEIELKECPASLVDYYLKNYPVERPSIWLYEDMSGDRKYYCRLNSKVIWFDREGRYMRKKLFWN